MSGVIIAGDTSGSVTLQAPAVSGTTVITLPATSGTMALSGGSGSFTTVEASSTIKGGSTIAVGNATPSASGAGITFPATANLSTDPNTLDDYEEGTWTPTLGGTATYAFRNGYYTRIGNVVNVSFDIGVTLIGTGDTQFISGLPFAQSNNAPQGGCIGVATDLTPNFYMVTMTTGWGSTTQIGFGIQAGLDTSTTIGNQAVFKNSTRIGGTLTYNMAS